MRILQLDHVLTCAPVGAPMADRLTEAGFLEGSPNRHPGQGTANRRFFFDNAFIEFIWVEDESEARSELVRPTRLWERWRWRETGASPFGICLRPVEGASVTETFQAVLYKPPYLPERVSIPIASATRPEEPMIFINTLGGPPSGYAGSARQPLEHPNGRRRLSGVRLTVPATAQPSDAVVLVAGLEFADFAAGDEHLLELTFDDGVRGNVLDLRPDLPVILHT